MTNEDLTRFRAELDRIDTKLAELQPQRNEAHASVNATLQRYTDGGIGLDELQAGQVQRLAFDETYNALTARRAELEKAIADALAQLDREGVLASAIEAAANATTGFDRLQASRKHLDEFLARHGLQMMQSLVSIRNAQSRFRQILAPMIAKHEQRAILLNRQAFVPADLAAELETLGMTKEMLEIVTANQILLDLSEFEEVWIWIMNFYSQPGKRELLKAA